tara:strand:+ start:1402 stop:1614 length:213 start_codon:yes stop_codon:yes gene_type:complete
MRKTILDAVVANAEGNLAVHKTNVEVYLQNPAGIGEHSDIVEAVIAEVEKMAHWQDVLDIIDEHFEETYN